MNGFMLLFLILTGFGFWVWLIGSCIAFVMWVANSAKYSFVAVTVRLSKFFFLPLIGLIVTAVILKAG